MNGRNKRRIHECVVFASNWAFSAWSRCAEKKSNNNVGKPINFDKPFFHPIFLKRAPTRLVLFFFLSFLLRPRKVESELKPPTEEGEEEEEEEADWLQTILPPGRAQKGTAPAQKKQ